MPETSQNTTTLKTTSGPAKPVQKNKQEMRAEALRRNLQRRKTADRAKQAAAD